MTDSPYKKRLDIFRSRLREKTPCDAAWISEPHNRRYLSGFRADDPQINESSGSLLIDATRCLLLTDSRYVLQAQDEAPDFEIIEVKNGVHNLLPSLLLEMGAGLLGFEEDQVTWGLHHKVSQALDGKVSGGLSPLGGLVEAMREVKDSDEIAAMEASGKLIASIVTELIENLKPGLTERKVAWTMEGMAAEAGADGVAFPPIVASGSNGALPHAVPADRRLQPGEPIVLDMGVRLNGYCSDMTRTVFLGEAEPEFRKVYSIVREAQLAGLKEVRPGVRSDLPDAAARRIIADAGYGPFFGHALGHGVGLATHEGPRLSPLRPVTLEEGMVVTVEPGIYLPGKGGVRLEEMVLIEAGGARILTPESHYYDFRG
ncbi:M24 family metallopeptidase [Desulfatiglans anilini]|uniref:M24 family metallopeptidase n=1 Tax=Desulfatiglans anilini TaxID=90728 RepID=UPI00041B3B5D|nr:Xaa-Pro peptidase family protein [Desulfatiglans anilini]